MADEYNAELHREMHRQVMQELTEIKDEARSTNGRVRIAEQKIAVLEERSPGKQGGAWGALSGLLGGFLAGFVKPQ
jgi:hypothetical protein